MKKIILITISTIIAIIVFVALAGIYKFNYLASLPCYDADGNPIKQTEIPQETIYFSEVFQTWQDNIGACRTCTPENGFGADGVVDTIAWRELWLELKNDAGESPSLQDVKEFFMHHYAEPSGYFPVRVGNLKGVFIIFVPVPKELKDIDFLDSRGSLLATYDVVEHYISNTTQ